jgi:hypothetical protein
MDPGFEQPGPEDTVDIFDFRRFYTALLNSQLLPEGKILYGSISFVSECEFY